MSKNSNVVIGRNLLTLFAISKISGILLMKFENDTTIGNREGNLFQKKKCYFGVISNLLLTSFHIYIVLRGIHAALFNSLEPFTVASFMFICMFLTIALLLINVYFSNESTIACLNEAYKFLKVCKVADPISTRCFLLIALPFLVHTVEPLIQLPNFSHFIVSYIGIMLLNFIAIPTVLIIVFAMRVAEVTCDKIIADLKALSCMSPNTCYFKLRRVLVLYIRVADFIDSISPTFAFKILVLVGDYFLSSYFTMIHMILGDDRSFTFGRLMEDGWPIVGIQLRMIVFCSMASQMQQKASKIEKHVDDLLIKAVIKDQYLLKTKLAAFKIEIQARKYKISPYGLFSLNMDLYTSILTVLASNCAMILQLFSSEINKT